MMNYVFIFAKFLWKMHCITYNNLNDYILAKFLGKLHRIIFDSLSDFILAKFLPKVHRIVYDSLNDFILTIINYYIYFNHCLVFETLLGLSKITIPFDFCINFANKGIIYFFVILVSSWRTYTELSSWNNLLANFCYTGEKRSFDRWKLHLPWTWFFISYIKIFE